MKEIKVIIKQNNKQLTYSYHSIDSNISITEENVKDIIIKLNIFESLTLSNNVNVDINNHNFNIEVIADSRVNIFSINYYRIDNEVLFNKAEDFVQYGNCIYLKKNLLSESNTNNSSNFILNYNFKPLYKVDNTKMNFGLELEISCGDKENLEVLIKDLINKDLLANDKIILKNDSSILGNNTVEIVTAPVEIKEAYNFIIELSNIFKKFNSTAKAHNIGGMHIHCSYILNNIKVLKLINFIYNKDNVDFLNKISQRTQNRYFNFDLSNVCDCTRLIDLSLNSNTRILNNDRYSALNFTSNTIEFRIFNSNLRQERLLKNLNFVESILFFIGSKKYSKNNKEFQTFINSGRKYKYF